MFEKSGDTAILERLLKDEMDEVGNTVTYEQLSEAIGRDVRAYAFHNLRSARAMLERDEKIFTVTVHGVGIKRVDGKTAVRDICGPSVKRMGRKARKTIDTLGRVDTSKLNASDHLRHIGLSTSCLLISHASKESTIKRIEKKCNNQEMALGSTLRLFLDDE